MNRAHNFYMRSISCLEFCQLVISILLNFGETENQDHSSAKIGNPFNFKIKVPRMKLQSENFWKINIGLSKDAKKELKSIRNFVVSIKITEIPCSSNMKLKIFLFEGNDEESKRP